MATPGMTNQKITVKQQTTLKVLNLLKTEIMLQSLTLINAFRASLQQNIFFSRYIMYDT